MGGDNALTVAGRRAKEALGIATPGLHNDEWNRIAQAVIAHAKDLLDEADEAGDARVDTDLLRAALGGE